MAIQIGYVEDDTAIRENYAELLRDEGFAVEAYATKQDAITAFSRRLPDIALLDVSLNGDHGAGTDICRQLRQASRTLPVIFLTSHDSELDRLTGLQAGADDYLSKDSPLDSLVVRIQALCRRRSVLEN